MYDRTRFIKTLMIDYIVSLMSNEHFTPIVSSDYRIGRTKFNSMSNNITIQYTTMTTTGFNKN